MSDVESASDIQKEAPPTPTFPEGGTKGWMAVLGCWCVMFNTFGYINAFGYAIVSLRLQVATNC